MTEQQMEQGTGECTSMQGPDEHHERLAPFVGTFKAVVKMWMGPGEPLASTGVMTNTMALDGRFLQQVYEGDPGESPFPDFQGRGYWGYNHLTSKYEGFWIDTASTIMQTDTGDVDESGTVWTMIGSMPGKQPGTTTKKKSVITLKDHDHHSIVMYFEGPDGGEFKGMEIQYTRA